MIILFCLQYSSNSGVAWLLWPSRMSRRYDPTVWFRVHLSKWWIQSKPSLSGVQPLSLTASVQSAGIGLSRYRASKWTLPGKMIKGGIIQPTALIHLIVVTHRRSPGYITVTRPTDSVKTNLDEPVLPKPTANPVSSGL